MTPEDAQKLREPFPDAAIGKLPKGGVMLDYVGHAAVTDRLLQIDPCWTWEPLALTEEGLPALDRVGNLWIKLTCAGVTRIGVGDGKNAKECISDAIRNAAMRFGVALDLWAKEDLQSLHNGSAPVDDGKFPPPDDAPIAVQRITEAQRVRLRAIQKECGVSDDTLKKIVALVAGVQSSKDIPAVRYDALVAAVQNSGAALEAAEGESQFRIPEKAQS